MVLVTFALAEESRGFRPRIRQRRQQGSLVRGRIGSREVGIYPVGMGAKQIGGLEIILRELRPDLVINSGFAGAVRGLLEPGDLVLGTNVSEPSLAAIVRNWPRIVAAGNFHSDGRLFDAQGKQALNLQQSALCVDMESTAISGLCEKLAVKLLSVRMISDRANENLPSLFSHRRIGSLQDFKEAFQFVVRMLCLTNSLGQALEALIVEISLT